MNAVLRYLSLLLSNKKLRGNKKWLSLLAAGLVAYQAFSVNGIGADLGIPSFDTFYKEPRDVLISRVEAASSAQEETVEEFRSALEEFKSVTGFDGGDLEKKFNKLNGAFKSSEEAANNVSSRIDRVVAATNRLLTEWRAELDEYNDPAFKRRAQGQFDETRMQAEELIAAMRKIEGKTEPVLAAFRDQVLFLKHNLNMNAISSLQQESANIEQEVAVLIQEMEASINEAQKFVNQLGS